MSPSELLPREARRYLVWITVPSAVLVAFEVLERGAGREFDIVYFLWAEVASLFACVVYYAWLGYHQERRAIDLEERVREAQVQTEAANVRYVGRTEDLIQTAAEFLERVIANRDAGPGRRLDYYGGAGLLGAKGSSVQWKHRLKEALESGEVTVRRYIDFKSAEEMWEALSPLGHDNRRAELVADYLDWMRRQADAMRKQGANANHIHDVEAAPMWRWGIHVVVFDCRDFLIAFNYEGAQVGIVVENEPKGAKALVEMLVALPLKVESRYVGLEMLVNEYNTGYEWCQEALGARFPKHFERMQRITLDTPAA